VSYQALEGFRLSRQQERLWRLGYGAGKIACTQSVVRISGTLPAGKLRQALAHLLARHEMLRTVFRCLEGMDLPIQVILEELEPAYRELTVVAGVSLDAVVAEERGAPFDFENGPVVRFALVTLADDEHALVITSPAVSADAVSHRNLAVELGRELATSTVPSNATAAEEAEEEEVTQYVDFAEWQDQLFGDEEAAVRCEEWRSRLTAELLGAALPIELGATDLAAPPERVATELVPELVAAVERAAAQLETDLPRFVRAAWAVLLRRYLDGPRMLLGVHHQGRKYGELALAQGPFGKVLPLVLEMEADRPFARVVEALDRAFERAEEWEEYFSFEVFPAQQDGAPSVLPFSFDVALPVEELAAGALRLRFEPGESLVDLSRLLLRVQRTDGVRLELLFAAGSLETTDAERLLGQLGTLLTSAAEDPQRPIAALEILSADERRQLLATDYEETPAAAARPLHRRIREQANRSPEAVAVLLGGAALSFGALRRRIRRLARVLKERGVGLESRVPIVLPRSLDQVVAVLAVLETDAAFVPLDPAQPRRRLVAMLEEVWADAPREALLTHPGLAGDLEAAGFPALVVEAVLNTGGDGCSEREDDPERENAPRQTPPRQTPTESLAYLLFTSGSTGRPKGAMIRHGAVANLTEALEERIYRGRGVTKVSLNAPLSFDASIKQLVQLAWGRTLVIIAEEVRADGEALLALLERERVEGLDCTPSQLGLLLEAGLDRRTARALGLALVGGEAISPELWHRLATHREVSYWNVYGPTECTVDTTACPIAAGSDDSSSAPSLGPAIANAGVFVLDRRLEPVPLGIPGELVIAGAGLARGYAGRPRWTAERFVPDPFADHPGARLYRSGDRVEHTTSGRLNYLGRIDHQVKLRGFRIELGEIESVLKGHPAVADAVVAVREDTREDTPGAPRLVAYVIPRRRTSASIDGPTFRLPNGLTVAHRNRNETEYLYKEIFIDRCYARHGINLPEGACVFDVGANIGMFTLFVLQECRRPRIYAFEPLPPLFETLKQNRDFHGPEVKLFSFGLSDVEHHENFTFYPRYTMMSGQQEYARPESEVEVIKRFLENQLASGDEEAAVLVEEAEELLEGRFQAEVVEARLRRLSDVFREEKVEHIDLLKIDVQRAEVDVLRGIDEEHWAMIDQVVMELHDDPGTESAGRVGEITDLLEGLGFSVITEQDELLRETDRYNLFAARPHLERPPSAPPRTEQTLDLDQLREVLRERLPEPMVPQAILSLGSFPLNRHGKVDRGALPAPEQGEAEAAGRPPRTPFEEVLLEIWTEVLGFEGIGVEDSFFEIGGHSILATRLMARVRQVFAIDLPLRVLFEESTVETLALRVEAALQAGEVDTAPPLEPVSRDQPLALSFAQQRLWFLHQLEPESSAYNNPKAIHLVGRLEVDVLRRAFNEVVRRHEVLRTTFPSVDGEPVQRIAAPAELPTPRVDLRRLEPLVAAAEGRRLALREGRRAFDLAVDRPLRITLVEAGDDDFLVLFTLHHIASDAWSLGVLTQELGALYEAFSGGLPSPLPELGAQYADFAAWQRSWLRDEVLEAQLDYWRRQLAGLPALLGLPTDRPRQLGGEGRGERLTKALPAALVADLEGLARERGATLFMVLLAGFETLLGRWAGVSDLAVGAPVAGRRQVELEVLIGCFLNTLVLRGDLRGRPSFDLLVQRAREVTLGAYAHQALPFETLVDALRPERSLHHSPLFQVLFSLTNVPQAVLHLPGVEVRGTEAGPAPARFDLSVILLPREDGLDADFQYAADLFDRTTVQRLAASFERLLAGLVAHPAREITAPSLLGAAERAQVVVEWNDTGVPAPRSVGLHGLFAAQAERTPEAVAVLTAGGAGARSDSQLSYGELQRAATGLAQQLRERGAGPEVVVGVALERTPDLVVALLGILQAGAAYLPLDPGYPAERLIFQLTDAEAALLVTEEDVLERFPQPRPPAVFLKGGSGPVAPAPAIPVPADRLAYVIYTSGSTGRP
jgi:amino acid adenylation domain-containing protein/FkbM family methyltransferase